MKTIIEIGANDGNDTMKFVSEPDTFLWTFEPVPYMADRVVSKLENAGYKNYKMMRYAVSDTDGIQQFNLSDPGGNWACSSLNEFSDNLNEKWPGRVDFIKTQTIDVQTIRMDTFIEMEGIHKIDYFHCDAQGSDFTILKSFGKDLDKLKAGRVEAANKVALYNSNNYVWSIITWLLTNNFNITKICDHFGNEIGTSDLNNSTEEVDIYFERG